MKKKEMYTLPEIAKMLHITLPEVENYVENGSLKIFKGSKKDCPLIMHVELMDFLRYYPHKLKKRKAPVREEKNPSQVKQLFPKETTRKKTLKSPKKVEKKRIKPVIKPSAKKKIKTPKPPISLIKEKQISKEKPKKVVKKIKSYNQKTTPPKPVSNPLIKKKTTKPKTIPSINKRKDNQLIKKGDSLLTKALNIFKRNKTRYK